MNDPSRRSAFYLCTLCTLLYLLLSACSRPSGAPALTLSAASSLALAFEELASLFEPRTGIELIFNFGASGRLAHQIEEGAPVDLFASADPRYIEELAQQGLVVPGASRRFARGLLVLWTRSGGSPPLKSLGDLRRPELARLAIANPSYAPYGAAARQVLQKTGLWQSLQPRLILGQNVRQTLQYAASGNVDAALVALSLCRAGQGRWIPVPDSLYGPIYQTIALVKTSAHLREGRRFAAFLATPPARKILQEYGFRPPEEEMPP